MIIDKLKILAIFIKSIRAGNGSRNRFHMEALADMQE
jgi:hypothetical protein